MTLVHQHTNGWADSASDVDDASIAHHGGLSDFGKAVVQRMNDLGVAVDVSHASATTHHSTKIIPGMSGVLGEVVDIADLPFFNDLGLLQDVTDEAKKLGFDWTST